MTCIYRDEAVSHRMPVRLMELVNKYPYGSPSSNDDLLPRPRFSTRQYDALLVRVETQLTTQRKPKHSPNKLISDAFEAEIMAEDQEYKELWEQIKDKRDNSGSDSPRSDGPDFARVFADDTIRFLSLLPDESTEPGSPTYSLFKKTRKRSLSLNDQDLPVPSSPPNNNGTAWHANVSTDPAKVTTITPTNRPGTRDWMQFSTSGFAESGTLGTRLAATLMDKDLEISAPPVSPSKQSRFATSPTASRRSMESHSGPKNTTTKEEQLTSSIKVAQFSSVQIDEAFIDFWGDALTDPISCNWPPFVLCKLKSDLGIKTKSGKTVDWLVIARSYIKPAIPEPQSPDGMAEYGGRRTTSPRPSVASQGTFSSAKKRFSIFNTGSRTSLDKRFPVPIRKKANSLNNATKNLGKSPSSVRVGEMGEVLREEDERESPKARPPSPQPRKPLESAKRSVGESAPAPPMPPLPVSVKEGATAVRSSTQERVTGAELATTSAVIAAVGATAAIASSDLPKSTERAPEPASESVDRESIPSSSTVSAPEVSVSQAATRVPAAEPEAEPLETVIEAVEEPPAVPTQPQEEVVQEETVVVQEETVVAQEEAVAVQEETVAAQEEAVAVQEEAVVVQEEAVKAEAVVEPTSSPIAEETSLVIEPVSSTAETASATVEPTSFPVVEEEAPADDDEPAPVAPTEDETATTTVETTAVEEVTLVADESTPVPEAPVVEDVPVESEPAAEPEVVVEPEQDAVIEEPQAEVLAAAEEPKAEEGPTEPPSEDLTQPESKVVIEENGHADDAVPREEQL